MITWYREIKRRRERHCRARVLLAVLVFSGHACVDHRDPGDSAADGFSAGRAAAEPDVREERFRLMRERMVRDQIEARGIRDARVLEALRKVPRHQFLPKKRAEQAYEDRALPIGEGQTISQPYIVARMTEALNPAPDHRVLEIGTGSGYQAAVLSGLVDSVYTIEIVESLGIEAEHRLERLGYGNVVVRIGDGYRGWDEHAPFNGIIVTAAPDHVPRPLVDQLGAGGRMVIPVGRGEQYLMLLEKSPEGVVQTELIPVRFVPMTGEAEVRRSQSKP